MFKDLIFELIGINRYSKSLLYQSDNIIIMTTMGKFMFPTFGNIDADIQLHDMIYSSLHSSNHVADILGNYDYVKVYGNPENAKEYFKDDKDLLILVNHGYIQTKSFFIMTTGDFTEKQKALFDLGIDFYD